jgi:hypothetical protein
MARLQVMNPVARSRAEAVKPAGRAGDLGRKTVGLYWNMKAGGDVALDRTAELLTRRYPGLALRRFQGSVGQNIKHLTGEDADRIARECQAVVATTAD